MDIIRAIEQQQIKQDLPVRVGDNVKVHYRIVEGAQAHPGVQGDVIPPPRLSTASSQCARSASPSAWSARSHSPKIEKMRSHAQEAIRRAKLYYLRDKVGKAAKIRSLGKVTAASGRRAVSTLQGLAPIRDRFPARWRAEALPRNRPIIGARASLSYYATTAG